MTDNSVIRLHHDGRERMGLTFLGHLEDETVLEGKPTETGHNYFTDTMGWFTAADWECTPCTTQIDAYPVDEFCTILSGTVVATDGAGRVKSFKPGNAFAIPRSLRCAWHMPENTRKNYVIFDAAAAGA